MHDIVYYIDTSLKYQCNTLRLHVYVSSIILCMTFCSKQLITISGVNFYKLIKTEVGEYTVMKTKLGGKTSWY